MDLSPDGKLLYVAVAETSAIYVIDTARNQSPMSSRRRWAAPLGGSGQPDGTRAYSSNGLSDSVSVIDTGSMSVIGQIAAGRGAHSVRVGLVDAAN